MLVPNYFEDLKKRAKQSHVYRKFQLTALQIAELLSDKKHIAIYMKLAKERNQGLLLRIAKEVAEKKGIKNRGAYFMKVLAMQSTTPVIPDLPKARSGIQKSIEKYLK